MGRRCLILALTALLLTGCAGSPGQSAATLAPAESDRVVIYTSHKEEVYGPIVKEFEARTGIWAEVVTGGTNELLARIAGEADAPVCDVIFGGGVESLTAYERYFQPYACAEADLIRPGLRPADDLWTPFSSLPVVLIYNTKLVSPGELTGWESLLSGRWSGSIALADPTVSGSSYTAAATMLCALPGDDWDQLDRLAVQLEGRVLPDSGDVAAALDRSELDEQRVYSVLYRAAAPVLGGASLSVYGADGRQLYSTSSQPASGSLSPRWGLLAAAADGGVVYRGASSKSSACIQAACAVRRGSVPLGYVVADVTAAQLTALFDGQHTATSRLLLLDPFWDQVYASSDLPAKTLAARLRSQLLAGQALSDSHGAYDYFVRQEPRSGFCLVLQQPKPMTEGTAELMYLVAGLSLLLCLGLCVLASMRFSRQLFEPIHALNSAMREVEEGNLNVQLDNRRIDEMGQLSGRFNRMAQRLRQNLKDSLRQQRELNEAQIRMMQAQLNPHFLYNTLDTIKWMGKIHQAPEIATISADLADILRSSISADELVPLRQELRLVERYVEIQNIRFSGAFALTVEVDEPLRDVPVPKLMLQPLVENAILHGFRDRSGGEIRISAYRTEEDLILTVRDNGCGVPEEVLAQYRDGAPRPGGHFGLHNVDAILRIRYGPDRGVRFVPVQGEGACIRITLPVFRKGEEPPC